MAPAKSKAKSKPPSGPAAPRDVPAAALWTTPIAWAGDPLRGVAEYTRSFSDEAVFVRADVVFNLRTEIQPGWYNQREQWTPGLIQLDKGAPTAVHVPGFDGRCWTYMAEKQGRKTFWRWHTGPAFPATEPADDAVTKEYGFEYFIVQSLLPFAKTDKHILFMVHDDFHMENFATAKDPDPND